MRDQLQRLKTALTGRYEIERELGAGGMATVYLALDARHNRRVALKVLRDELSAVIGADRFLSEIQTTANLQHPHILPLFDSGEADGLLFFVMPYVEGHTLADRLLREKQLPIEDAVRIAAETAEALDYAHRHGVIHRDVKPANILLYEGRALVADFGIALAVSEASGGRVTETGLSLGTPQYMSPEQAAGERSLDARTDVFALGCVLYEMLAGEPPHDGPNAQAILARVLTADPRPVTQIRKTVPLHVAAAVETALQKLPADRFATAKDFARALVDPSIRSTRTLSVSRRSPSSSLERASLAMNAALAVVLLILGVYAFNGRARNEIPASPWVTRMSLPIDPAKVRGEPALSPDGRRFAWAASDGIHVRSLDQLNDRVIPGTAGAWVPRFSHDGSSLAFEFEKELRVVPISGGPQRVLARRDVSLVSIQAAGAASSQDGWYFLRIPYSTFMAGGRRYPGSALMKVRHEGGALREVLAPDSMRSFSPNQALPGTNAVLGTTSRSRPSSAFSPSAPGDNDLQIAIFDETKRSVEELFPGRSPAYEPQTGHIVFLRDTTLMAAKFSKRRLAVEGRPFPVAEGVGAFGLAEDGTLWSVLGVTTRPIPVSIDRYGTESEIISNRRQGDRFGAGGIFSPDGTQIVVSLTAQGLDTADVWVYTPATGHLRRLTYGGASFPAWSLDGRFILFTGPEGVYEVRADGSSPAELVLRDKNIGFLQAVHGGGIVFEWTNVTGDLDVGVALRTPGDSVRVIVGGKWNQEDPAVSPDGRWLAYESNETGRNEVYVVPFHSAMPPRRVSVAGGHNPLWSTDGRELFFRNGNNVFEALRYRSTPSFQVIERRELFNAQQYAGRLHPSPDGSKFLASRRGGPRADARYILTRNWARELSARSQAAQRQATSRSR